MSQHKIRRPTPEEDAVINAGIAADPDTLEGDDEFFARAKPASADMQDLTRRYRAHAQSEGRLTRSAKKPA